MTAQAQRRQNTRNRILRAAEKLFKVRGFEKTSVDQIVMAADVAKGTFYQYFETKIDVALAIVSEAQQQYLEEIQTKLDSGQSPLSVGREFLQSSAGWFEKNRGIARGLLVHTLEAPRTETPSATRLWALIFAAAQRQGEIRADMPAEEMSALLVGNIALIALHWSSRGKRGQLADWLSFAWRIHLEGVLPR